MESIIKIKDLHKSFGEIHAVNGLSIEVKRGQLFAFLGLNGAGKSTTISIMCGHETKDSGEVFIDGMNLDKDLDRVKSEIGVVFQFSVLDKVLTVKDNLQSRASLYGLSKEQFDATLVFFGHDVSVWAMYLILGLTVAVLIGLFILLGYIRKKLNLRKDWLQYLLLSRAKNTTKE